MDDKYPLVHRVPPHLPSSISNYLGQNAYRVEVEKLL